MNVVARLPEDKNVPELPELRALNAATAYRRHLNSFHDELLYTYFIETHRARQIATLGSRPTSRLLTDFNTFCLPHVMHSHFGVR